ncbi:MAG: DUF1987 domain-containing protein [Bacteroidales bacterium]|nr:DUF1987 domain-containing protein [Bacteroidales bacterium]
MPVIEHLTNYLKTPAEHTRVIFFFDYINSSSKKFLSTI